MVLKKFKSNFNKVNVVRNAKIKFRTDDGAIISFKMPTLGDMYDNLDFDLFLGLISMSPDDMIKQQKALRFIATNVPSLINGLVKASPFKELVQEFLKYYIDDFEVEKGKILIRGREVKDEEIEFIISCFLIATNKEPFPEEEEDDELEKLSPAARKLKEKQLAIEKKLKKAKQKKAKDKESSLTVDKIMFVISHEFNLSIEEVMNLNLFTISWYFSYVGLIDVAQIERIAAGNGLSKKGYTHYINKK